MSNAMPECDLKQRFAQWAQTYGGEQFNRLGYSSLDRIGEAPANDDADPMPAAAQLESIVQTMEQSGRWKQARVLRAEYFMASLSEPVRLTKLRRLGLPISRASYYVYLRDAHTFVAGALSSNR